MFDHLIGNDPVKDALTRLRRSGRIPNSMLFVGDEGVGKREFALEIARSFLCTSGSEGEVCGSCSACFRSINLNLPDSEKKDDYERVHFSDHADLGLVLAHNKNILVDAIRALEVEAHYRPFEAAARFFIIDDAHKLNDAASNALLKTLEEPFPTSHIFLITSRPGSLLPTIRSRCQTVRFSPIEANEIAAALILRTGLGKEDAALTASLAKGSMGRALELDLAAHRESREIFLRLLEALIQNKNLGEVLKIAEEISDPKNKDSFENNLDLLQGLIHDIWSAQTSGTDSRVANIDVIDTISGFGRKASQNSLIEWMGQIEELRRNLGLNVNKKIATDALLVKMAGA